MLKRMQVLEEKGIDFATRPLRSLPVIGKAYYLLIVPLRRQ